MRLRDERVVSAQAGGAQHSVQHHDDRDVGCGEESGQRERSGARMTGWRRLGRAMCLRRSRTI